MGPSARVFAVSAQVKVCALRASVTMTSLNLQTTAVASASKGWCIWIVQVIQHHGAAVLGPPDGVKLVVVALAQRQECLQPIKPSFLSTLTVWCMLHRPTSSYIGPKYVCMSCHNELSACSRRQ